MSRPPRPTSSSRSRCSGGVFDWEPALRRLDELNARSEDPNLWNDSDRAQTVMRERTRLHLDRSTPDLARVWLTGLVRLDLEC